MLYKVFAVFVVLLPVFDCLLKRVMEESDGAVRVVMHAKYAQQGRLHKNDRHSDFGPQRRLENVFPVFPELRVRVVDGIQLQTKRAAADHVGRVFGHHLTDFDSAGVFVQSLSDGRQQTVAALLYLFIHVFQFIGRKRGTELLPHCFPSFTPRKKYIIVERIRVCAGV